MKINRFMALFLAGVVVSASTGALAQDKGASAPAMADAEPLPAGGAAGDKAALVADGTLLGVGAAAAAIAIIAVLASGGGGTTTTTGTR